MIEKWSLPIPAITGDEPRMIYVYIPKQVKTDPDARFPVLYMMDGHNLFYDRVATYGKSWGLKKYMDRTRTPAIIVGIDCNHHPDNGRLSEYSPFNFQDSHFGRVVGRGELFMDWLVDTLKPIIDERYPTIPDREATWIAGSSMGGLMTIYAMTAYKDTFSRGAALSPSVWVSHKRLNRMIRETDFYPETVLYMDYGSHEFENHEGMQPMFTQTAALLMDRGVNVTARVVPGGDHCEACWEEQIPFFMRILFYERGE